MAVSSSLALTRSLRLIPLTSSTSASQIDSETRARDSSGVAELRGCSSASYLKDDNTNSDEEPSKTDARIIWSTRSVPSEIEIECLRSSSESTELLEGVGSRCCSKSNIFRILNLPRELILTIFELCEFETLHALTRTSRLISEIAFLAFLAASGLILPEVLLAEYTLGPHGVVRISTPEQALALFVWKRHLSFRNIGVLNVMLELAANRSAIMVDRILYLFESPMPFSQPFADMINIYISSVENGYLEATRLVYGLQNSKCARLTITGLTHINELSNPALYHLPLVEPTDTGYKGLEVFRAYGSFPFLPHILPFTVHNFMTSNLRELELNMNGFCVMRWSKILRSLFLPHLEKLDIGGAIAVVTILKFLRRHRKLRSLSLSGITTPFVPPDLPSRFMVSLSELKYIRAPSLYLGEILRHTRRSSISCITVLTDTYKSSFGHSAALHRSSVKSLLKQVARFPSITNLEFYFSVSTSTEFCSLSQDTGEIAPETLLSSVNIISLHKYIGLPFDDENLAETIRWISLFPNVNCVELWDNSTSERTSWMSTLRLKGVISCHHYQL